MRNLECGSEDAHALEQLYTRWEQLKAAITYMKEVINEAVTERTKADFVNQFTDALPRRFRQALGWQSNTSVNEIMRCVRKQATRKQTLTALADNLKKNIDLRQPKVNLKISQS